MRTLVVVVLLASTLARAAEPASTDPLADDAPPPKAAPTVAPGSNGQPMGKMVGIGVAIGAPVGASGKVFLGPDLALALLLGFWGTEYGGGAFDVLWHPVPKLGDGGYGTPYVVIGGGVGLGLGDAGGRGFLGGRGMYNVIGFSRGPYTFVTPADVGLDVHGTLGLGWAFHQAPVDLFADFSPGILLVPDLNLGTRFTIGGRWWF